MRTSKIAQNSVPLQDPRQYWLLRRSTECQDLFPLTGSLLLHRWWTLLFESICCLSFNCLTQTASLTANLNANCLFTPSARLCSKFSFSSLLSANRKFVVAYIDDELACLNRSVAWASTVWRKLPYWRRISTQTVYSRHPRGCAVSFRFPPRSPSPCTRQLNVVIILPTSRLAKLHESIWCSVMQSRW